MRKKKRDDRQPQIYEERIGSAVQALVRASSVVQKTSLYLREQLGDEWRDLNHLLEEALVDQVHARMWLKKALKK